MIKIILLVTLSLVLMSCGKKELNFEKVNFSNTSFLCKFHASTQ